MRSLIRRAWLAHEAAVCLAATRVRLIGRTISSDKRASGDDYKNLFGALANWLPYAWRSPVPERSTHPSSGATAIEYGLIAAGISVAIIAVVNGLGTKLRTSFTPLSTQFK